MRTYEQLQNTVLSKGYNFFDTGAYNLNIIMERTTHQITNEFDDWMHIAFKDENGSSVVMSIPATTKPGLNGNGAVLAPNSRGTAILVPDQYKHSHKFYDTDKGWEHYPFNGEYFRQMASVKVWRDKEKRLNIEQCEDNTDEGLFGINIHKMSNPGKTGFPVNNWSEGCQGAEEPHFKTILPIVREAVSRYGDVFTLTLIESTDFLNQ
jgi:hypothetical protein